MPVELLELVLLLLAAVLVSTVVDQLLPRVSLPLVQIAVGAVVALVASGHSFVIDSELFLVLLIAPLLFDESRNANKRDLWKNKGSILSLAIGLVVATMLAVGFALHWLEPSIPLAAAFALGAALGPTDAVAVSSLSKDVALSKRQNALLSGEALINDASGVVSFQFAIAAATTGAFSLLDASVSFVVSFFGGILMGLVLGLVALAATRYIRNRGYDSVTVHVVLELFTPFIVFLAAENVGVSGILAVVAAGLLMSFAPAPVSSQGTRLSMTSSSVWEVVSFIANGVVFVLLGMELPQAIVPGWNDTEMDNGLVVVAALLITALLVAVRFVWVAVMEAFVKDAGTGRRRGLSLAMLRDAFVTTLAGPKGAVTLSIAFTIPVVVSSGEEFPFRNTLICISSVVILLTLLLANFLMPVVAPKKDTADEEAVRNVYVKILLGVVNELRERTTPQNAQAMQVVLRSYEARIEQLRGPLVSDEHLRTLGENVIARQKEYVLKAVGEGRIDNESGRRCIDQLARMTRILERGHGMHRKRFSPVISLKLLVRGIVDRIKGTRLTDEEYAANLAFMDELERCALEYLEPIAARRIDPRSDAARVLVAEHNATLASIETRRTAFAEHQAELAQETAGSGAAAGAEPQADEGVRPSKRLSALAQRTLRQADDIYAQALRRELDLIQEAAQEEAITRSDAQHMREEVYLLQMGLNQNEG